ncbi:hypothetical protein [Clostridium tagluense]|uniref:Uncharacterized protein n=1 Tax=Clostridium tagluense TaxID=360422 RepID=A0A401UT11_9CLOT|nr:hypothetical protein [Clostridium tagluense]GCD12646.1 hypothetical protein Ctaglu_42690 [Clostridium tagluense]
MNNKKCCEYKIIIRYMNNDVEEINYHEVNNRNYKEMLKLYKETKEHYTEENICATVNFQGIFEDGTIGISYVKEIINKKELQIKEQADNISGESIYDLTLKLESILTQMPERIKYITNQVNVLTKDRDNFQHEMITKGKAYSNRDKIEGYDRLLLINDDRRLFKEEKRYGEIYSSENIIKLIKEISEVKKLRSKDLEFKEIIKENIEDFHFVKDIHYTSYKHRDNLKKSIGWKYSNIIDFPNEMILKAYNKCGSVESKNNVKEQCDKARKTKLDLIPKNKVAPINVMPAIPLSNKELEKINFLEKQKANKDFQEKKLSKHKKDSRIITSRYLNKRNSRIDRLFAQIATE